MPEQSDTTRTMTEINRYAINVADVRVTITLLDEAIVESSLGLRPIVAGTGVQCNLVVRAQ